MSSAAKISGRKRADSHEIFEIPEFFTQTYNPDESDRIPFQEFLDFDVNNEKWEAVTRASTGAVEKFQDIYTVLLPRSLEGYEWKPIEEIFPNTDYILRSESTEYPDLVKANQHILHSEFIRSFISSIETLYYLGNVKMFPVEHTSQNFSPSFEREKWRPWFHIYSNCKSGKGISHHPTANKAGKYIIRLFWLGSWKKLYISDKMPVDFRNRLLLPILYIPEIEIKEDSKQKLTKKELPKKKTIEIWPFLLAKSLMVLASLTWTEEKELVDFDIIQCLTGWISNKLDVAGMDPLDVWQTCLNHTFQYTWCETENKLVQDKNGTKVQTKPSQGLGSRSSKRELSSKNLRSESKGAFIKKSYMHLRPKEEEINKNRFVVVVEIQLDRLQETLPVQKPYPWTHGFLVAQTRTVPILKPSSDEEFESWKRFRWIDWAIEHNYINPRCPPHPIRSFKAVDPFRYQYQYLIPFQCPVQTEMSAVISKISNIEKDKYSLTQEFKDISEWLDLETIDKLLKYVTIYYVPSSYKAKTRISNLKSENITKETKYPFAKSLVDLLGLQWKEIIRPEALQNHRNDPFYIFCDCLYKQSVVINLNQTGYLGTITERFVEEELTPSETPSDSRLCASLFERVKRNYTKARVEIKNKPRKSIRKLIQNIDHQFPKASIIVSNFKWNSNRCNDFVTSISTLGSGCLVLNLKPGRHIFTMWVKVEGSYSIQVVSDSCLCVGTLEETLTLMNKDSLLFRESYWNLVETFKSLIYSFGSKEYMNELNEFYKCFKPQCDMTKKDWLDIQAVFFKEFFDTIQENLGPEALRVVKILFRKWQLTSSYKCDINDTSQICVPVEERDMLFVNIMQESAVKIQSFFRGVYERIMLSYHDPDKRIHDKISSLLVLVCDRFMQNDRRLGSNVLRRFIQNRTIPDLKNKFSWCETLTNDISMAQFTACSKILEYSWVFIARHIFLIQTQYPLTVRINIFCNLSQYYIRVYDNDTSQEMKGFVNDVAVNKYPPNNAGYTVVAYGWSTKQAALYSKIMFVCHQDNIENLLTFSPKNPKKEIISDYYVPNSSNILCRYILDLKSESTVVTLYLSTDYPKVRIKLVIFNSNNPEKKLIEVSGVGYVTVPSLILKNTKDVSCLTSISAVSEPEKKIASKTSSKQSRRKGSKESTNISGSAFGLTPILDVEKFNISEYFVIEATIENDSWPLTASEWNNVEKERSKLEIGKEIEKKTGANFASDPHPRPSIKKNDGPRWTIEAYYNHTDYVSFYKDPEKDDLLKRTKLSWYEFDPVRFEQSQKIRNQFIKDNVEENPNLCTDPTVRSLDKEIFQENVLPPLDLTPYLTKPLEEVEQRHLLTNEETWEENFEIMFNYCNSIIDIDLAEKFKESFFKREIDKLQKINDWFDGVRRDSEYMMEQAFKKRERYIERIKLIYLNGKKK